MLFVIIFLIWVGLLIWFNFKKGNDLSKFTQKHNLGDKNFLGVQELLSKSNDQNLKVQFKEMQVRIRKRMLFLMVFSIIVILVFTYLGMLGYLG